MHWLVNQQWEIFASAAWKGYLEQGRGVLSVLLGQESDPTMGLKRDAISLEMPMEYFGERGDVKVLDPVALMSTIGHKLRLPNICQKPDWGSVKLIADKL